MKRIDRLDDLSDMSDASQEVQPSEPQPIVNGDAQANGDAAGEQVEQQEELVQGASTLCIPAHTQSPQ